MTEVLDIDVQRRRIAARKGFQAWTRRFSDESFDENTRMEDLGDATLATLIRGGEEASMPLYDFILGVQGKGMGPRFYFLENPEMMAVMDIAIFILDQLRFEAMRRLGWIEEGPASRFPLLDLVRQFSSRFAAMRHQTPALSPDHPRYKEYLETFEGDRASFIRRLIPEALETFQSRYGESRV